MFSKSQQLHDMLAYGCGSHPEVCIRGMVIQKVLFCLLETVAIYVYLVFSISKKVYTVCTKDKYMNRGCGYHRAHMRSYRCYFTNLTYIQQCLARVYFVFCATVAVVTAKKNR